MRTLLLLVAACLPLGSQSLLQNAAKLAQPQINPYAGSEKARMAGAKLFRQNCAPCHGQNAQGNGRRRTPPLTTPLVHDAEPGTLFWVLRNGSVKHGMPSFAHLPETQRWQLITYLKGL